MEMSRSRNVAGRFVFIGPSLSGNMQRLKASPLIHEKRRDTPLICFDWGMSNVSKFVNSQLAR